jgi:hypothetical protein
MNMKKIINGKIYDTEKAECIAEDWYSNPSDFRHTFKELYVTKKGNYFFYAGGGPLTEWAVSLGNNTTGGSSDLIPTTEEEAREFITKVDPDLAIEKFPDAFQEA